MILLKESHCKHHRDRDVRFPSQSHFPRPCGRSCTCGPQTQEISPEAGWAADIALGQCHPAGRAHLPLTIPMAVPTDTQHRGGHSP